MPSPAVSAGFNAYIGANFTAIPTIGVNASEPPSDGSSYMVPQYPVVNGRKPGIGRRFFEDGAVRLVINAVRAIAETDGETWAATVAGLFRDKSSRDLNVAGLQTFTPNGPIVDDSVDLGDFVELAVIVPYRYQFDG